MARNRHECRSLSTLHQQQSLNPGGEQEGNNSNIHAVLCDKKPHRQYTFHNDVTTRNHIANTLFTTT
jgi:hypothetical protein